MIYSILAVFMIIYGTSTKNKRTQFICFTIGIIIPSIFVLIIYGVIVPYFLLSIIFKGYDGIIGIMTIMSTCWLVITLIIKFKNRIIILKNNEKEIYVRDIEVDYSPAIVSYLMNNKIETKKDLPATLLNLCAKNILKIEKDEKQKVNIIDQNNKKEFEKLKDDEKYACEMFKTKITSSKISKWKNIVKKEYEKYGFSKKNKIDLLSVLMIVYFVAIIIGCILSSKVSNVDVLGKIIIMIFFATWGSATISGVKMFTKSSEFIDTYTIKGALEYNRWKKFEKFIEDYTLIKEKEYLDVIILGEYLSYATALGINKNCDKELYNEMNRKLGIDIFSYFDKMDLKEKDS